MKPRALIRCMTLPMADKNKGIEMVNKSLDTTAFKASIKVSLIAINQYGDEIGTSTLDYSIYLKGSLIEIVTKLEALKN
jgi:hypothetical protein